MTFIFKKKEAKSTKEEIKKEKGEKRFPEVRKAIRELSFMLGVLVISFMITMGFVLFAERNTLKIGGFSGEKQAFAIKNEAGELKMQFLGEEYTLYKK